MACQTETFNCDKAYLGQFSLNVSQTSRLTKLKDYRPNDEERDEIIKNTADWLNDIGFEDLDYKT